MKSEIVFIIISLIFSVAKAEASMCDAIKQNESLLLHLDTIITNHHHYIERKENRIAALRGNLRGNPNDSERLSSARALYNEYIVYDSDSALHYARLSTELTKKIDEGDKNQMCLSLSNEAFIYAACGSFEDAAALLRSIKTDKLSKEAKYHYFKIADYVYSIQALFMRNSTGKNEKSLAISNAYRDSVCRLFPERPNMMLWAPIAQKVETGNAGTVRKEAGELKAMVDSVAASGKEANRDMAINSYWLARYFESIGDDINMVKYKTLAAIYDAEIENREIAAIQELATFLFEHGDLSRAYNYLLYNTGQINAYKNRTRIVSQADVLSAVRNAYLNEIEKHDREMWMYLMAFIVMQLLLIVAVIYIIIRHFRLKRTQKELESVYTKLKTANETLENKNSELIESNTTKQGIIALILRLSTDYITALDDFQKKLVRKYKLKQFDELGSIISNSDLVKEQYQSFYIGFDHTVLSIFPNLIEEYNISAPAESKILAENIEKNKGLNTRLRIYALRRLGVEKSTDIARMLNISIRTVYNNRNTPTTSHDS